MGILAIVLLIVAVDCAFTVNASRSGIGQGALNLLEMGGVLAEFGGVAAELSVEEFKPTEDERAIAFAILGDLLYRPSISTVQEEDDVEGAFRKRYFAAKALTRAMSCRAISSLAEPLGSGRKLAKSSPGSRTGRRVPCAVRVTVASSGNSAAP
jgi:hypothetical protein